MAASQTILRVVSLDGLPALGELIASYLRVQFQHMAVEHDDRLRGLGGGPAPCGFVLVQRLPLSDVRKLADAILRVRSAFPQAPVLVAAASANSGAAAAALSCGAQGFVAPLLPLSTLRDAVRIVLAGGSWFPQPASEAYEGPCRRKAQANDWSGPERRRLQKP